MVLKLSFFYLVVTDRLSTAYHQAFGLREKLLSRSKNAQQISVILSDGRVTFF